MLYKSSDAVGYATSGSTGDRTRRFGVCTAGSNCVQTHFTILRHCPRFSVAASVSCSKCECARNVLLSVSPPRRGGTSCRLVPPRSRPPHLRRFLGPDLQLAPACSAAIPASVNVSSSVVLSPSNPLRHRRPPVLLGTKLHTPPPDKLVDGFSFQKLT
jgi:hypothetical protein